MDRNGAEPAQYAWSSVRERGGYHKKPQVRTWEFYMKLGTTLRTIESSQGCWNKRWVTPLLFTTFPTDTLDMEWLLKWRMVVLLTLRAD